MSGRFLILKGNLNMNFKDQYFAEMLNSFGIYYGLGAKIKKNRSVAPPRKKNSIATMHQVYISGAWKTMFD